MDNGAQVLEHAFFVDPWELPEPDRVQPEPLLHLVTGHEGWRCRLGQHTDVEDVPVPLRLDPRDVRSGSWGPAA